jgi:uncharacterized membrane protein
MALSALAVGLYALGFFAFDALNPPFKARFAHYPVKAYLHIIPGGIALILGAVQFSRKLRSRHPALHRRTGLIYVTCVILGATGALLIAPMAHGSVANSLGFVSLGTLWLYSVLQAYRYARAHDFVRHRRWMTRNYALTFAAVTLRLYLPLLQVVFGLGFDEAYAVVAWLCWIPNLVIVEWLILASE